MNRLVLGMAAVFTFGSAAAQTQDSKPVAVVHAEAGAVQIQVTPVAVDTSAGANAGDVVSVAAGGRATVTYANGCTVQVANGYQILATAPICETGAVAASNDGLKVAGGVAAAALALAAVASGGRSDDRPSSP